jgi:RNA polymerase sigma factor (sigma-70 family)
MPALAPSAVASIADAAALGDDDAWRDLVTRFEPQLRSVVRGYRLSPPDVDDVVQTTWLQAYANLGRLRDRAAVGGWLVVVARREALRSLQRGAREVLTPDAADSVDAATPERLALERERVGALGLAIARLTGRQRTVAQALLARPGRSYEELADELGMPVGSIGPTRERAFERLRSDRELAEVATW